MKQRTYKTVIVGCGVLGASIAYYLSKKQSDVLVIDKAYLSSGTSGATQAWVWIHTKQPGFYAQTCLESAAMYASLVRDLDVDVEFQKCGGLSIIFDEAQLARATQIVKEQNRHGIRVQLLDKYEVLKKEPHVNPDVLAATFFEGESAVFPMQLVRGLVLKAQKQGASFSYYHEVLSVEKLTQAGYKINTRQGPLFAEQVVLASGVWTKALGESLALNVPVELVKGEIMITEALPPLLQHIVSGIRQLRNGKVLIGYSKEHAGLNTRTNLQTAMATANQAIQVIPKLRQARIVRNFAGIRSIPEDGLPILGEVPGYAGLHVAVTHSGFTLAPYVGNYMAEALAGEAVHLPDRYNVARFNQGGNNHE